jgi:spore coat protein CotH
MAMNPTRLFSVFSVVFFAVSGVSTSQELTVNELFPVDRVLEIKIDVDPDDWESIRYVSRDLRTELGAKRQFGPVESPYEYVKADITIDGVKFEDVGLRKKGFIGSQSTSRPSFKIKLDYKSKKKRVGGLSTLTLNNNQQDTSLLSQYMGYSFFRDAGLPAPRCAFAKVTLNGNDLGVYSHVESAKKNLVENGFGNSDGTLYEGTVVDFHQGWGASFDRKFGKKVYGQKQIEKLIEAVKLPDGESFGTFDAESAMEDLVAMDQFYQFWAVESLLGFWDGYSGNRNNFFFYVNRSDDKIYFIPWGGDCMFQKFSMIDRDPRLPISVKTKGILSHRLYQNPESRERYRKTLVKLMDEHWDEELLLAEVDRIEELVLPLLSEAQKKRYSTRSVKRFIKTRRQEINAEMKDGMPEWTRDPGEAVVITDSWGDRRQPVKKSGQDVWMAAKNGDMELLKDWKKNGGNIDQPNGDGTTPLIMAALGGQFEVAKFLIENNANVDSMSRDRNAAIHSAAFLGRLDIVQMLVEQGANVEVKNRDGATAVEIASQEFSEVVGFIKMVDQMLDLDLEIKKVAENRRKVVEYLRSLEKSSDK